MMTALLENPHPDQVDFMTNLQEFFFNRCTIKPWFLEKGRFVIVCHMHLDGLKTAKRFFIADFPNFVSTSLVNRHLLDFLIRRPFKTSCVSGLFLRSKQRRLLERTLYDVLVMCISGRKHLWNIFGVHLWSVLCQGALKFVFPRLLLEF